MDFDLEQNDNSNSDIVISSTKYDHNKKVDLVKKINKIKKKEYLVNIFKIITTNGLTNGLTNDSMDNLTNDSMNQSITKGEYTENRNGVYIFFHNLNDEVYEKLEAYVNNIYKIHRKKMNIKSIVTSELSDNVISCSENMFSDSINIEQINKELSNKEKMIMRRKNYEKYLNQNQNQNM